MWQPNERYPDAGVRVLDPAFNKYRLALASVERLYTGCRWAEGPVYFGDGRYLLWSDIPNNRVLRWDEESGNVTIFRKPSNNANGHTRDRRGRLVACEHDARRVVRFEYDGAITVLADSYNGKPLNSPNDVVVKSDGSVWFSDPTFGILGYYEGHKAESENTPAGQLSSSGRALCRPVSTAARSSVTCCVPGSAFVITVSANGRCGAWSRRCVSGPGSATSSGCTTAERLTSNRTSSLPPGASRPSSTSTTAPAFTVESTVETNASTGGKPLMGPAFASPAIRRPR